MSWLYSRALEAEYLAAKCLDGVRCAPSSMNNTQPKYYYTDKIPESWKPSRYGMTCAPLTADRGEELLTWYREVFLAKTSQQQEKALASPESGLDCGVKWRESSVKYDLDTHGWKTVRSLFPEDLPWSSVTLPKWGTLVDGVLSERTTPERLTAGIGVGYWPTPTLAPDAPNTNANRKCGPNSLTECARIGSPLYPTPKTNGFCGGSGAAEKIRKNNHISAETKRSMLAGNGGSLNPDWVEWLMGWPIFISSFDHDSYISGKLWRAMQYDKRRICETSATDIQIDCLFCVWNKRKTESTPQRHECREQHEGKCSGALCVMSCKSPSGNGDKESGTKGVLCGMWENVSAETLQEKSNMLKKLSDRNGQNVSEQTMGESDEGKSVCLLWEYIHTITAEGKDVFSFLWEQARVGKTQ